jgi:hypothetical protein
MDEGSKYAPLTAFLEHQLSDEITLTFDQIRDDDGIGVDLPQSARVYRAWWGNEEQVSGRQCRAWLKAGWEVANVDLDRELVTFRRR